MHLEVGEVGLGGVQGVAVIDPAVGMRTAEGDELLWNQPVEVTVLKFIFTFWTFI